MRDTNNPAWVILGQEILPVTSHLAKMSFESFEDGAVMDISQWIISLLVLTGLEIILGIDNIIFLTILAGKLPPKQQPFARKLGLIAALVTRLGLLFTVNLLMGLTTPLFTIPEIPKILEKALEISLKDLILIAGDCFLWPRA